MNRSLTDNVIVIQKNGTALTTTLFLPNLSLNLLPFLYLEPPPDVFFDSLEDAVLAANRWAEYRGYAMIIGRSNQRKDSSITRVKATCDRYGPSRSSVPSADKLRKNRGSIKTECKMHALIQEEKG
jgi:hypothetical protein